MVKGEVLKPKNKKMANKGRAFEEEVIRANKNYRNLGQALIQKISTPWVVKRVGTQIVSAHPSEKSTLDFRGTVKGGLSISFDCKETEEPRGLPLSIIEPHQIDYMKHAISVNEKTFLLCHMKVPDKRYYISGETTIQYYERWRANLGKRGFNYIPVELMTEIKYNDDFFLDYLRVLEE